MGGKNLPLLISRKVQDLFDLLKVSKTIHYIVCQFMQSSLLNTLRLRSIGQRSVYSLRQERTSKLLFTAVMIPPIPILADYGISPEYGFLPAELPLERLPDPYYNKWEAIVANLQGLILSKRLRGVIEHLPILSTAGLEHDSEWRRAYSLLCFMAHGYIWGGDSPSEVCALALHQIASSANYVCSVCQPQFRSRSCRFRNIRTLPRHS